MPFSLTGKGETHWQSKAFFAKNNLRRVQPAQEPAWQAPVGLPSMDLRGDVDETWATIKVCGGIRLMT
jgi:hypothetical protein